MEKALTTQALCLSAMFGTLYRNRRLTHSPFPLSFFLSPLQVVGRLKDMGFSEAAALKALEDSNWDETAAVNALLSS